MSGGTPDTRPVLVTGGAGFVGCNLVDRLCREGHRVHVYDSLARPGVEANLAWLRDTHGALVSCDVADIRDRPRLAAAAVSAKAVFHFAAQVAVTTSLVDPTEDFAVNIAATVDLLEAVRRGNPEAPLVFASTNKVYGNLSAVALAHANDAYAPRDPELRRAGVGESIGLSFHTPYGCSKGAADQYVLDYAHSFGLRTCVMRMSCIYGPHQMGTEDQGWVAHFVRSALAGETITLFGDGHQVRDILHVDDAVEAYLSAWEALDGVSGQAFNLGGGPQNAVSLIELIRHIEFLLGIEARVAFEDWRAGDQRWYVSDRRQIDARLALPAPRAWREGVADLVAWCRTAVPARIPVEAI